MIARDFGLICEIFERFLPSSFSFSHCRLSSHVDVEKFLFQDVFILVTFFSPSQEEEWKGLDWNFFSRYFPSLYSLWDTLFIYLCVKWRYSLTFKITITFINPRVSSGLFELFKNFTIHLKNTRIELQNRNKINV